MVYTIWFIWPTQTQLCLPKSSTLISVLCKSKGRMWAQWEIHVGPLTRAELSINNWVCCSGLHLPRAAKLLLTAAASSCQPSSQTDQLPQINPHYFKPIPSSFPRSSKVSLPETVPKTAAMSTSQTGGNFSWPWIHIQCLEVVPAFHYLDTTLNSCVSHWSTESQKCWFIPWRSVTSTAARLECFYHSLCLPSPTEVSSSCSLGVGITKVWQSKGLQRSWPAASWCYRYVYLS